MISDSQYGAFAENPALGAADYKLNVKLPDGTSGIHVLHVPRAAMWSPRHPKKGASLQTA